MTSKPKNIALAHPLMIIGGAERLMLDLALALKSKGHRVKLFTTSLDQRCAFREAIDGTIEVETIGNKIPNLLFNRFQLIIGIIKMFILTIFMLLFRPKYDLYIVDTNPYVLPLFKLFRRKVVFYGHFPDKLLAPGGSKLFRAYRWVMGLIEECCFLFCDQVWVNSGYSRSMYQSSFKLGRAKRTDFSVVYPCINFDNLTNKSGERGSDADTPLPERFFFSLNRIERKKKIELAIQAFALLKSDVKNWQSGTKLVIAGGYVAGQLESRTYLADLEREIDNLQLKDDVIIMLNISSEMRLRLLNSCIAVLYTPPNEHFGIVPVEAMYLEKPVICQNNGGPVESVGPGCGFLLSDIPKDWADKMALLLSDKDRTLRMGKAAKQNAIDKFSFESFADIINSKIKLL